MNSQESSISNIHAEKDTTISLPSRDDVVNENSIKESPENEQNTAEMLSNALQDEKQSRCGNPDEANEVHDNVSDSKKRNETTHKHTF